MSNKVTFYEFTKLPIPIGLGNELHRFEFAEMTTVTIDYNMSDITSTSANIHSVSPWMAVSIAVISIGLGLMGKNSTMS